MGGRCDGGGDCYRMPLFRPEPCMSRGYGCPARTVRLENPACPDEWAEVTLSVDECGNMVICVHRALPCCRAEAPAKRLLYMKKRAAPGFRAGGAIFSCGSFPGK